MGVEEGFHMRVCVCVCVVCGVVWCVCGVVCVCERACVHAHVCAVFW